MPDVFLSYSSKDRAAAQRVQQALEARGIDVFWDQETPAGQDWDTWIRGKLTACRVAIVLWSKTSVKSDNVRHEALVARKTNKLLPAMIDPIAAEDLPMGLYMVQTVNLTDWRDANSKGLAKLADEIIAQLGGPVAATSTPARRNTSTSGMSPRAQTTVALVAIATVVGGVAWFMMQQKPADIAAQEAPPSAVSCPDGGVPILGVCPQATAAQPVSAGEFAIQLPGHWNWDGLACADGPNVSIERGRLIFTTPDSRYVHVIESDSKELAKTRVESCTGCAPEEVGNTYSLSPEYVATSSQRNFNLVVENTTKATRDIWSPCELAVGAPPLNSATSPTLAPATAPAPPDENAIRRRALQAFVGTWKTTMPGQCDSKWRFTEGQNALVFAWLNAGEDSFRTSNLPQYLQAIDPPTVTSNYGGTFTLRGNRVVQTFGDNPKVCEAIRE